MKQVTQYPIIRVLFIKPFFFLWMAEIFSQVALNMLNFILIILVFKLTNSNTAVSTIVLSFTIPAIIFGMPAGIFVDRWSKKKVLFATNAIRSLLLLVLAFSHSEVIIIFFLSLITSIVTQFFIPAETPVIPLLVKDKKLLMSANALFGTGIFGSVVIAYALSGPILLLWGETAALLILSGLFIIAAFFVSLMQIPKVKGFEQDIDIHTPLSMGREMGRAFILMMKTKQIYHSLFLLVLSQLLILTLAVVGPAYAHRILGIKVDEFPLFLATPAAIGVVVGAFLIGNFFHNHPKERSVTIGVLLSGIALMMLPFGSRVASKGFIQTINTYLPPFLDINILHIMVIIVFVLGLANAFVFVPSNTLLQEATMENFRGKVYGALNALVGIFSLLPIIIIGGLSDAFGVGSVLTGIGATVFFVGILRMVFVGKK